MKKTSAPTKYLQNWYVWIFPLAAILICGWFVYDYFAGQGPRIHILFEDAAGIQPEKTTVRFRGVVIGTVKEVSISPNENGVDADVLLNKTAERFAVEGSKFSLIKPKVNFQGISGLDTIVEGSYITVLPGSENAKPKSQFKAQAASTSDPLDNTSAFIIETEDAESMKIGASVSFRGMDVGNITKMHFTKGARTITVQVNIENRFAFLVRNNTVFWRKVGIQAKLGFLSADFKMNSMDSIMNGGIQFATPNEAGARAKDLQKFLLSPSVPKDLAKWKPDLE